MKETREYKRQQEGIRASAHSDLAQLVHPREFSLDGGCRVPTAVKSFLLESKPLMRPLVL